MKTLPAWHKLTEISRLFRDHDQSPHLWWSGCNWWSGVSVRSSEVTWGHNPFFFFNNSWQDGDRDAQMVPNALTRQAASEDMHIALLGSWPDFDMTWGQILKLTFQFQKVYIPNRLDKANTMVSFSYLSYQRNYQWITISLKNDNFSLDDLWSQNCWP